MILIKSWDLFDDQICTLKYRRSRWGGQTVTGSIPSILPNYLFPSALLLCHHLDYIIPLNIFYYYWPSSRRSSSRKDQIQQIRTQQGYRINQAAESSSETHLRFERCTAAAVHPQTCLGLNGDHNIIPFAEH